MQGAAARSRARHTAGSAELLSDGGTRIRVGKRRRCDLLIGHRPESLPICLVLKGTCGTVWQKLNQRSVTPPFGYDNIRFLHVASPSVPR